MKLQGYIVVIFILFSAVVISQDKDYKDNPDKAFLTARALAFDGERGQARDILKKILANYPVYTDVQNLLAKTLTWDKHYTEARLHYNAIITREKDNEEVWVAAIKNELYSKNYDTALGLYNKALKYLKANKNILTLKNNAISNINTVKKEEIKSIDVTQNSINVLVRTDYIDVIYDQMYFVNIGYKKQTKYGSIIPQINYSNRFATNGIQFQIDAYPTISKKYYAYISYAFSSSSIYPKHRLGAEIYASLSKTIVASLGSSYIQFNDGDALILTGSVGLYTGNYYFSWRPYVSPSSGNKISFSNSFKARKYLKDKHNYLSLDFGFGFSPELTQFVVNNTVLSETLLYLESQNIKLSYNFTLKNSNDALETTLGLTRQELIFSPDNFYLAVSAGLNYKINW